MATVPSYIEARIRQRPPARVRVLAGSTPVVAFGDMRRATIATLGLNPSKFEFLHHRGGEREGVERRLETLKSLGTSDLANASPSIVAKVFEGCNDYFQTDHNPYRLWFNPLEKILKRVDADYSYYTGLACHLDLVQWATDPVWGELEGGEQEKLLAADLSFFRAQLSQEQIRLLLLCGKTVIEQYCKHFPNVVHGEPCLREGRIKLYQGQAGSGLVVIGWNINIQRGGDLNLLGDAVAELWKKAHKMKRQSKNSTYQKKRGRNSCPKVSKKAAVSVSEATDILRRWRKSFPRATRLDGRSGENAKKGGGHEHWLHISVDGYGGSYRFRSQHGRVFRGRDYNGIVNFHADTKATAVDLFIELVDEAKDYHDVLCPSATYEMTEKLPKGRRPKPKFALQGHPDERGFFLYHDEWRDKARRSAVWR
jgi:hypothetical protein